MPRNIWSLNLKHIGVIKPDSLVKVLNWFGVPLIFLYVFSMFVYPWLGYSRNWNYVQSVWSEWQSLNVGMLALLSSMVAFNISRYNANKQRERDFEASRAFLPEALSEISSYLKKSVNPLLEALNKAKISTTKEPLESAIPNLPESYKDIFSKCISLADPDVGEQLANILRKLQLHNSRIKSLQDEFHENSSMMVMPQNIVSLLYNLAEIRALVNATFEFARNTGPINSGKLSLENFRTAYMNLGIPIEIIDDLLEFTKRTISSNDK